MRPPLDVRDYMLFNSTQQAKQYYAKVKALGPIAYWPMWEASGAVATDISGNGRNGAYTGVTLGQTGIGDGRTCPLFDGVNDRNNIYTASLSGAFDGSTGSFAIWIKVSAAGVWTDTTRRNVLRLVVDGSNLFDLVKREINGRMDYTRISGGATQTRSITSLSSTDWIHTAVTWNETDNEYLVYFDGVKQGATLTAGTWGAGALSTTQTNIGALASGSTVWDGYLAHGAIFDSVLTAEQIASLAVV